MVKDSAIIILSRKMSNPATLYWRGFTKPGKWTVVYMYARSIDIYLGPTNYLNLATFYWRAYSKPWQWAVMYMCVRSVDFSSFYGVLIKILELLLQCDLFFFCISVYYTVKWVCKGHWSEPEMCPLWAVSFYT